MTNFLYKGMIALVHDTSIMLQQKDLTNISEVAMTVERMNELIFLFETKASKEKSYLLPLIRQESILDQYNADRDKEIGHLTRLKEGIIILEQSLKTCKVKPANESLARDFRDFMIFSLEFLDKKEKLFRKLLAQATKSDLPVGVNYEILMYIFSEEAMPFYKWVLRGLNETEIVYLLKAAEQNSASKICRTLLSLAEQELPAITWEKVQDAVAVGALLA